MARLRVLAGAILVCLACAPPAAAGAPDADALADEIRAAHRRAEAVWYEVSVRDDPTAGLVEVASALDEAEAALRIAETAGAGDDPRVLVARISFLGGWAVQGDPYYGNPKLIAGLGDRLAGYARELLGVVRGIGPSSSLWERARGGFRFNLQPALLAVSLTSDPADPEALAALALTTFDPQLQIALFRAADRALATRAGDGGGGPVLAAWLLQERVASLLHIGLAEQALAEAEAAPAPVRALVLDGGLERAGPPAALEAPGSTLTPEVRDLRLDLAAAYALRGDGQEAARRLAALPPAPAAREHERREVRIERLQRESLTRLLILEGVLDGALSNGSAPAPPDDFGLLVDRLNIREPGYDPAGFLWRRLESRLAETAGHPEIAGYLLATACRSLSGRGAEIWLRRLEPFGGLPPAVMAELVAIDATVQSQAARFQAELDRLSAGPSWVTARGCPEDAGIRFDAPRLYTEPEPPTVPLPEGAGLEVLRIGDGFDTQRRVSRLGASRIPLPLPAGVEPAALLDGPGGALALVLPRDRDTDHASEYELLRSSDGGRTWGPALGSGLGVRSPFEVVAGSPHHRVTGDRLVLEATVGWRHPALPELTPGTRVLLDLPLSDLLADSDGDGLSDRDERRVGTDPGRADSDGDGIDDAHDRLTAAGEPTGADLDTEQVMSVALRHALRWRDAPGLAPVAEPSDEPIPAWWSSFVVGEGMPLGELRIDSRVVLVERHPEGTEPALEIHLLAFDAARERALVDWRSSSASAMGVDSGRYLLVRTDGPDGWRVVDGFEDGGCITVYHRD